MLGALPRPAPPPRRRPRRSSRTRSRSCCATRRRHRSRPAGSPATSSCHGQTVPAGSKVVLLTASAGRDEREYPDPDRFDVGRELERHVTFGYGIHFCLGAALGRDWAVGHAQLVGDREASSRGRVRGGADRHARGDGRRGRCCGRRGGGATGPHGATSGRSSAGPLVRAATRPRRCRARAPARRSSPPGASPTPEEIRGDFHSVRAARLSRAGPPGARYRVTARGT